MEAPENFSTRWRKSGTRKIAPEVLAELARDVDF